MTKEELRYECKRLFGCRTLSDCNDLLDIYIEFLFMAIKNHHQEPVNTTSNADAKIIAQMMMTKALHLKNVISGISFHSQNGYSLNRIIDPTIVASLTRNIFETTGIFNLIYRHTKNHDEKAILYLLWVHSGLKYRQKFEDVIISNEGRLKYENEKKQIEEIRATIEANELYKKLDEQNQGKIQTKLKEKDYLMRFENSEVIFLHWHELTETMGIKEGFLENIYSYFSLYSHPSNVSVFQFAEMFNKGEESFLTLTNFNLRIAFFMLSIFIADYIYLFPSVQETFNKLDIRDQIVINFQNTLTRGNEYSINESWKACE
jgi:hypothetical protein